MDVLIEHDGPILAVVETADGGRFLGLAVDRAAKFTRWIEAPISKLQVEALRLGGLAVRDVFVDTDELFVVDYNHRHVPGWTVKSAPSEIPQSVFPKPGALLPSRARLATRVGVGQTEFHLAGEAVREDVVAFPKLAAFMAKIQAFWSALSESLSIAPTPLLATAMSPGGSMVIQVTPTDDPAFHKVSNLYRQLTVAGDGGDLEALLVERPRDVSRTYADYLKILHLHRLEVLTESADGASYMGPRMAARARASVREAISQIDPSPETIDIRTEGYFEGFLPSKSRFEFYDLRTGATYHGAIERTLKHRIKTDARFGLTLGKGLQRYDVQLRAVQKGDTPAKYTLLDYRQVAEESPGT